MIDRAAWGVLAGLAVCALWILLSLGGDRAPNAPFRFVNGAEPRSLDPGLMTGAPEGRIANALFEGLTSRDAATLETRPGAARSWEISRDGKRYRFFLREDARWSDGSSLRAEDFAYAWRRLQDPKLGSEYAYVLHGVRLAAARNLHSAHAAALRGRVATAFEELAAEFPEGLPAENWARKRAELGLADVLRHVEAPQLERLLSDRPPTAAEFQAARDALPGEAARLDRSARYADEHFGIDEGVYAEDPSTLVVELESPLPYFLELTAFYPAFPVKRSLVEDPLRGADWYLPEHIISNGAFRLAEWRVGERIRLERSESYWDRDRVSLPAVDVLPIESAHTALNLYLSGDVHWLPGLYPSELVDPLSAREDFYSGPGMVVYFYRFNTRRPPLDDPRVRLALSLAVDREAITTSVLRLGQLPAHHIVPPGMPDYQAPESALGFDLPRARALLAEAGYPDGRGFPELGLLFNTSETHKQIASVVADGWRRELGISVQAYNQEWQAYLASVQSGDYDVARAGWIGDYRDPNTFLDMWVTGGGNNGTGWSSARYDRLIEAAANPARAAERPEDLAGPVPGEGPYARELEAVAAADSAEARSAALLRLRAKLLSDAEAILVGEAFPVMPIYFYVVSGLISPEVKGFYSRLVGPDGSSIPNLQDLHPLSAISLTEGVE